MDKKRAVETATKVAWSFVGTPYRWGGDDPSGFDCSGLVIEILKSVGILPQKGDWTAHNLIEKFVGILTLDKDMPQVEEGCLIGYWNSARTKIVHIEYCINDELTIGASGGGSRTQTEQDAWVQNAYVKVRPINQHRGDYIVANPFRRF